MNNWDRNRQDMVYKQKLQNVKSTLPKIMYNNNNTISKRKKSSNFSSNLNINQNTNFGIYGYVIEPTLLGINENNSLEVALKEEIETGKANILLTLDDGIRREYEIQIKKIYKNNTTDNKSMLIEITDKELIEKTGGIIQGMSGAPIIQNGKFVGAITHVLVNNPLEGYAVFGETMIKQMSEVGSQMSD